MSDYIIRQNLLKTLAEKHPSLRHGEALGGGKTRKSFYKNMDDLTASNINAGHFPCAVFDDFKGRLLERGEQVRKRFSNTWCFLDKVKVLNSDPSYTASQEDVYNRMELVMYQCIAYIKNDYEENGGCGLFKGLDLASFNWSRTGPYGDGLYGWQLNFDDEQKPGDDIEEVPEDFWLE